MGLCMYRLDFCTHKKTGVPVSDTWENEHFLVGRSVNKRKKMTQIEQSYFESNVNYLFFTAVGLLSQNFTEKQMLTKLWVIIFLQHRLQRVASVTIL